MNEYVLAYTINLNEFIVKIYHLDSNNQYVSQETIDGLIPYLNNLAVNDVLDTASSLEGIIQTEVYDLSNNLILACGLVT
jgi:hypothetical protein